MMEYMGLDRYGGPGAADRLMQLNRSFLNKSAAARLSGGGK